MIKRIISIFIIILFAEYTYSSEDITAFYKGEIPIKNTLSVSDYGDVVKVSTLLTETYDIDDGVYEVSISRIGDHIYKIDGVNLYIEMPYCLEICYLDDVILKVETYKGYKFGSVTFIE